MVSNYYPALIYVQASFASAVKYNTIITSPSTSSASTLASDLIWIMNGN